MASTGDTWRLGRRPALDGLRGVAVLLVVVSHVSESLLRPLGMAGVGIFFTLSGFLITRLLLEEHQDQGRISLRRFYARRVRRLAPAAVACIAVVGLLGLARPVVILGALTYSANWLMAISDVGSRGPLAHTWSLAIEEQFYLAWPLLLIFLLRFRNRALLVGVLGLGVAASTIARFAMYAPDAHRIYYGTDTRADGLLIGCLLAVMSTGRRRTPWVLLPLALASLSGVGALAYTGNLVYSHTLLPTLVAAATAVALTVRETRLLAWSPLRYFGSRSYGLYLWHWPIAWLVNQQLHEPGWLLVAVIGLPVSLLLTEVSWRCIEQPFMRRRVSSSRPADTRPAATEATDSAVALTS